MADEAQSESLRLHISIGGVTIDVEGPVDEAETWFEGLREDYLSELDAYAVKAAADGAGPLSQESTKQTNPETTAAVDSSGKSRSLSEFYRQTDDLTKQESALVVGWYLEHHEGHSDFISTEVEERAKNAKISLGANVSRDLSKQAENAHLEKVDKREGKDAYHLTLTGESYIQEDILEL